MSFDFLHNIFSRGSFARTDSPLVSVGGVSSNSATLTYDVLHFDSTGNLLVNAAVGGGSSQISGSVTAVITAGTVTALAIWTQRLDATNDAITVYQNVTNSNWSVIASQSGNWTAAVSAMTGTVTVQALLAGTMTVSSVLSGTMSSINHGQARTTDPATAADGANKVFITDSLGKQVVLPGSVPDLTMRGSFQGAGVLAQTLIPTPGAGRRIAVQAIGITASASEALNVIISGGPSPWTFGPFVPTGGISINAGGAVMYLTSASANLSVAGSTTASFGIVASGYQTSN